MTAQTIDQQAEGTTTLRSAYRSTVLGVIAIALLLALQFQLVITRSVNWDEFNYLKQVHDFARGELSVPLQTLHVRLFAWLPALDLPGVDQVIRGRIAMFGAELASCASIVLIARRFAPLPQALLCALAYLSVGYVFQHGFAFRTDPLAAGLAMAAMAILARARLGWLAMGCFALLVGAASMVTIKIVLLGPAFAGLAWLRWSEDGFSAAQAVRIVAAGALSLLVAGLIYLWHGMGIAPATEASQMLGRSGEAMFFLGISDNWRYIVKAALYGVPFVMALTALVWTVFTQTEFSRDERIALAAMALPLTCVLFYYNIYPYFFAFILAPVAASLAGAMPLLTRRYGYSKVALLFLGSGLIVWVIDDDSRLDEQRAIQQAVTQMFPQPVNYFDFPGFFPEHRKANFFMTRWGFRNYAQGIMPGFAEVMAQKPVPLLATVDSEASPRLLGLMRGDLEGPYYRPEDRIALTRTYRKVWGPLYVAGTRIEPGASRVWNVLVPGIYTVEGSLNVDGQAFNNGDLTELARGPVSLHATDGSAGLLWGDHLKIPAVPPPQRPYWTDF